jgi:hypothetical protein
MHGAHDASTQVRRANPFGASSSPHSLLDVGLGGDKIGEQRRRSSRPRPCPPRCRSGRRGMVVDPESAARTRGCSRRLGGAAADELVVPSPITATSALQVSGACWAKPSCSPRAQPTALGAARCRRVPCSPRIRRLSLLARRCPCDNKSRPPIKAVTSAGDDRSTPTGHERAVAGGVGTLVVAADRIAALP